MADSDTKKSDKAGSQETASRDYWYWIVLALVIIFAAGIRIRLASMPLERDEGEYAYIAQQMLEGVPPYESAYSMKMPGIYAIYALILAVFGQTCTAIHMGAAIFNAATIFVIFILARRMFGPLAGIAASAAYAITSLIWTMQGLSANAEHFVVLPAVLGLVLIYKIGEDKRYIRLFVSGLLFGLAFVIKQHGIFFVLFGAAYLFYQCLQSRPLRARKIIVTQLIFFSGVIVPFGLTCFVLWRMGVFDKFWFWTFTYANKYGAIVPLSVGWKIFVIQFKLIVKVATLIWVSVIFGLVIILIERRYRQWAVFVIGLLFFSFLSVCPGFYFRGHYFILMLPATSILAGVGFTSTINLLFRRISVLGRGIIIGVIGTAIIGFSLYQQKAFLFDNSPSEVCRLIYKLNPFPESVEIAKYINTHTEPNDSIAVIGSEPQIYFYSNRRAATRYIYMYPLMEPHGFAGEMQREMIGEIESARPKYLFFVKVPTSWLRTPDSIQDIFMWLQAYADDFYKPAGLIEIQPSGTDYYWEGDTADYNPRTEIWIGVFRRKG